MAYIFQQVAKEAKMAGVSPKTSSMAKDWFRQTALGISKVDNNKVLSSADPFTSFAGKPPGSALGKMYCYMYDPKTKNQLPYYDKFPLVFIIEFYKDGFLGINLHYLPPYLRAKLMDALYDTINNQKYDKTTALQITYSTLKGAAKFRHFKPCIKRYLNSHLASKMMYVKPEFWDFALMLPMQRFEKASDEQVWRDSIVKAK